MQSNGGLTTAKAAAETPMHIIECGPAAGRGRGAGADPPHRHRQGDLVRHGRHHRQGLADRERRGDARHRIPGRRRHRARLAAVVGGGVHAESAGDRPCRGRGRRRLDPVDRRRRRVAGRAAQRRCGARAGMLRPGRRGTDRDRRKCRARLYQPRSSGRRRLEAERRRRRAQSSPSKIAGRARHERRGGGLRRASDRGVEHDPRAQSGVERTRPRPARIRAGRRSAATARFSRPAWPRRCASRLC